MSVFLVSLTVALFWRVNTFEFLLLEDSEYAAENPFVQQGVTSESLIWAFTGTYQAGKAYREPGSR